jgi:hypothetical protein
LLLEDGLYTILSSYIFAGDRLVEKTCDLGTVLLLIIQDQNKNFKSYNCRRLNYDLCNGTILDADSPFNVSMPQNEGVDGDAAYRII